MTRIIANNATHLEARLTLVSWFAAQLGYANNAEMLEDLHDGREGWGERINLTLERAGTGDRPIDRATWQILEELDADLRADWESINRHRARPLSLKYFQYLAALASALFMRRLAESPSALWRDLNKHQRSQSSLTAYESEEDLYKLAFWMATGSGKTLLMHLHYRQFLRYKIFAPDNVLLITPNEELSRQHIAEMEMSGIPCFRHGARDMLTHSVAHAVRVIEITKLIREDGKRRKGKGESVPVETLAGRNLLFVDEGHKGAGGEEWFPLRDTLAKHHRQRGFVMEYSATFGQALNAELLGRAPPRADKEQREYRRAQEYARAILVDYSYRYFYGDGYGKDFKVLNMNVNAEDDQNKDILMLGNLLSFFQQQWVYQNHQSVCAHYGVAKPLLLLLGATVTGGDDLRYLLGFLHRVATDQDPQGQPWLTKTAQKIMAAQSGMMVGGRDLFAERFVYLKNALAGDDLAQTLRQTLFYAAAPGALRFSIIKQDTNEAALRVGDNPPFALVYVGDIPKLSEMVKADGIAVDNDVMQTPLFGAAHLSSSPLNILVGAKKFMEGWSSWRVCGMGMLNIGKSEGTQIIQLFGRGVRLQGQNFSLKRSQTARRDADLGAWLPLVETLNIFSIQAKYMATFRDYLAREGMEEEITVNIKIDDKFRQNGMLQTVSFPSADEFNDAVMMRADCNINIKLNYAAGIQSVAGRDGKTDNFAQGGGDATGQTFARDTIAMLDFAWLYRQLLARKHQSGRSNLIMQKEPLLSILQNHCCIIGDAGILTPSSYADLRRVQNIALAALWKYGERLYYRALKRWETKQAKYAPLFVDGAPTKAMRGSFADYKIRLPKDHQRINRILAIVKNERILHESEDRSLLRIPFNRHLYLPLLLQDQGLKMSPLGLAPSEANFVARLKDHLARHPHLQDKVFLLRNAGKGKGIGFYEDEGFFPDFLLWIVDGDNQRIIFVEPHGMRQSNAYDQDPKARLWERLQKLSGKLQKQKQYRNVSLDCFIISQTAYADLKPKYGDGTWTRAKFKEHHILFADVDYIADIFSA